MIRVLENQEKKLYYVSSSDWECVVLAKDAIEAAGDISPSLVAGGIKVALLTTVFGLIVAMILQIFLKKVNKRNVCPGVWKTEYLFRIL